MFRVIYAITLPIQKSGQTYLRAPDANTCMSNSLNVPIFYDALEMLTDFRLDVEFGKGSIDKDA